MPDNALCPSCGAPLTDAGIAGGLCARCLVRLAIDAGDETRVESTAPTPDRIGPYRLVEKIAEGGMGVVWRAEQQSPVRRTVAVKLIRPGLDSTHVLARFDAERQALALMDHPGIARIHDAGTTDDGRPYFVMEYVAGEPVTTYCDRRKLGIRERIELVLAICDAVQHAHHKGVVHRDLKPSNVLVTARDGKPAIKVIDFGIAKATQHKLTDRTLHTRIGLAVGTPEYMSPEQAAGNALDVDTRSDVYSLGVLLYELLVGALPFDPARLREAAIEEVLRTIREVDPPKPSVRLQTLGDASTTSAGQRSTEPRTLEREIRGDLDWIAMKALEKDRNRRYGSPAELAADLKRHLAFEPVLAGPPSAAYRAQKFARRHRVGVAIAGATAVALIAGIVGTTWGLVRARSAERQAREHATTAERVSDFLVGLFEVSDPSEARGKTITAREVLDRGLKKIETELKDDPAIRARLQGTMGRVYTNLGFPSDAVPLLDAAWTWGREHGDLSSGNTGNNLGWAFVQAGRYEEAERVFLHVIERTRASADGRDHARAIMLLGNLKRMLGRYGESVSLLTEAIPLCERAYGANHRYTLGAQVNLAATYLNIDRARDAVTIMERVVPIQGRVSGPDHPDSQTMRRILGVSLWKAGDLASAQRVLESVLESYRRLLGGRHGLVREGLIELGEILEERGELDAAETRYREAIGLDSRRENRPPHVHFNGVNLLGGLLCRRGRCAEAESLLRAELAGASAASLDHPRVGETRIVLARTLRALGKDRDALTLLRENVERFERMEGEWAPLVVANSLVEAARIEASRGNRDAVLADLRAAVAKGFRSDGLAAEADFASLAGDAEFLAITTAAGKEAR